MKKQTQGKPAEARAKRDAAVARVAAILETECKTVDVIADVVETAAKFALPGWSVQVRLSQIGSGVVLPF